MLLEIFLICALTNSAPYYDFDEKWIIKLYDKEFVDEECGFLSTNRIFGCASYGEYYKTHAEMKPFIILGNNTTYKDPFGMDTLTHEIKHMKCKCSWGGHLDRKE